MCIADHMISTNNSQGLPMAMRKDCRLPLSSGGTEARVMEWGGAPGAPAEGGPTRLALAKLASVSLPLPPFFSRSFLLPADVLLPDGEGGS